MALSLQEDENRKSDKEPDSHNILDWLPSIAGYEKDPYADVGGFSNSTDQLQLENEEDPEVQAALLMSMHDNNQKPPSHRIDIAAGEGTSDSTLAHIDEDELQAAIMMSRQDARSNK